MIAALWRILGIADLLHFMHLIFLRIIKICGIALTVAIGGTIFVLIGYWSLPKLLGIYRESRKRRLEENRQKQEKKRRQAAYLSELRATQAAAAAAMKEATLRQARENQAIKDKSKND
jgi:hypothetical protein